MKARLALLAISLLAATWSGAQNAAHEPREDPVPAAASESTGQDSEKTNEVTVVLPPPGEEPKSDAASTEPSPDGPPKASVVVTGKPPEDADIVEEPAPAEGAEEEPAPSAIVTEEPVARERKGLAVRVENIRTGNEDIDPSEVKLLAPFPAKPLAQPPAGWRLEAAEGAPPFTREVELSPGKHITLTVRPHLLVPITDGVGGFTVPEPGFDPSRGYRQDATVGAVLAKSIRQLDDDTREIGKAIDNLQQLLVSLPKPETEPSAEP